MFAATYTIDVIKANQEVKIQKILKSYEHCPLCK